MRLITRRLIVLAAMVLASPVGFAAEQASSHPGPWPGWHGHWPGFWWIFPLMFVLMLVFFALIFFAFRGDRSHWRPPWHWMGHDRHAPEGYRAMAAESALDILARRYALGEIDKEEYEEKKRTILSVDK